MECGNCLKNLEFEFEREERICLDCTVANWDNLDDPTRTAAVIERQNGKDEAEAFLAAFK